MKKVKHKRKKSNETSRQVCSEFSKGKEIKKEVANNSQTQGIKLLKVVIKIAFSCSTLKYLKGFKKLAPKPKPHRKSED